MKTITSFFTVVLIGCGAAPSPESREHSTDVTQACCTLPDGGVACSGPAITVQWLDRYWTTNPAEDDAGPCESGQACSAYAIIDAGAIWPLGSGVCQ